MDLYYIYRSPEKLNDAGQKYQEDIVTILRDSGVEIICDDRERESPFLQRKMGIIPLLIRCFRRIRKRSMVLVVFPIMVLRFQILRLLCILKHSELAGIVMDIESLRYMSVDRQGEFRKLAMFDRLIVQNSRQYTIIRESGYRKPISIQGILDFLGEPETGKLSVAHQTICYGGALSQEQSGFLVEWQKKNNLQQLQIMIYGPRLEFTIEDEHFHYCGEFSPEEVFHHLTGTYGLVWNGTSIHSLSGMRGEYYRFASPHKLSMYIMSGMPVIVHEDSAMADFVRDHHIGLTVNSLEDIEERISQVSDDIYREFVENVRRIAQHISTGYYLRASLQELIDR